MKINALFITAPLQATIAIIQKDVLDSKMNIKGIPRVLKSDGSETTGYGKTWSVVYCPPCGDCNDRMERRRTEAYTYYPRGHAV